MGGIIPQVNGDTKKFMNCTMHIQYEDFSGSEFVFDSFSPENSKLWHLEEEAELQKIYEFYSYQKWSFSETLHFHSKLEIVAPRGSGGKGETKFSWITS